MKNMQIALESVSQFQRSALIIQIQIKNVNVSLNEVIHAKSECRRSRLLIRFK